MNSILKRLVSAGNQFSNIGIKQRYTVRQIQKVRLINQYWLLYFGSVSFVTLELFLFNCCPIHLITITALVACSSIAILLNRFHKHEEAIMTLYVFVFFTIYYGESITRAKAGFSLFYFVGFFSIMCLMGVAGVKNILFYCTVMILAVTTNIFWNYELFGESGLSQSSLMRVYFINLFLTLALFIYFSFLVFKMTRREKRTYLNYLRERIVKENLANKSVKDKEILLVELHHRVKNNLAIISSMLNMQASKTNNTLTKLALQDTRNRVISMSLVHDMLYKSPVSARINFADYCKKLGENVALTFPQLKNNVRIVFKTEETYLSLSEAIPCGMILNELLTNSFKHAFSEQTEGEITISLKSRDKKIEFFVTDNGKGVEITGNNSSTLGRTIIEALADQLSAMWNYTVDGGTSFSLSFSRA